MAVSQDWKTIEGYASKDYTIPAFSFVIILLLLFTDQRSVLHPSSFLSPPLPSILSSALFCGGSIIVCVRQALYH